MTQIIGNKRERTAQIGSGKRTEGGIRRTERELSRFEGTFEMERSRFYEQYLKGGAGDHSEHIRRAGKYERLMRDGNELEEIEFCG